MGGAGDFRRLVGVDESSERPMASPWQFSLYALSAITVRRHAFLTIAPLANQRTVAFPPQIAGLSALHSV